MDPSRVNPQFSYESLDEELCEEMIVVAGHPFLAGGGRVAVLTGVVTLVLAPGLSDNTNNIISSSLLTAIPISVTDISVHPNIIIYIPRPEICQYVFVLFNIFSFLSSDGESGTPSGKTAMNPSSSARTSH